jgi:hypothetical protein
MGVQLLIRLLLARKVWRTVVVGEVGQLSVVSVVLTVVGGSGVVVFALLALLCCNF